MVYWKINSYNIALLAKCIIQYTENPVFAKRSMQQNIAPKDFMVKYCPPTEGSNKLQLFQYHPITYELLHDMVHVSSLGITLAWRAIQRVTLIIFKKYMPSL